MQAWRGANFVLIAVPDFCCLTSSLNSKKLFFRTKSETKKHCTTFVVKIKRAWSSVSVKSYQKLRNSNFRSQHHSKINGLFWLRALFEEKCYESIEATCQCSKIYRLKWKKELWLHCHNFSYYTEIFKNYRMVI